MLLASNSQSAKKFTKHTPLLLIKSELLYHLSEKNNLQTLPMWLRTYTTTQPFDIYVIFHKHQDQVMKQALSLPRRRYDVGKRI